MTFAFVEVIGKRMRIAFNFDTMHTHALVSALLVLVIVALVAPAYAAETKEDIPLIQVTGSGTIKAAPDRVQIELTVVTKNPDVKAAQKENARKMDTVMSALRDPSKGNLSGREIGTTSYSISEVYYPDDALKAKYGEGVTIYQVSNTISIETEKIDRVGDIIDIAVVSGANAVSSLQFTLSQEKTAELRKEALAIAVNKAHTDAETVVAAMGKSLGDVHEVTVDESYQPPIYYNQDYRSSQLAAAAPTTPIEPGAVEVTARVTAGYQIL
ncbi:SIMPL domain-containing protein [Methanospirillum purgamenti]|nr:SIMPL domain-containing protein [Methanospirillum hungatei]MDX8551387.1 SIMPL domain-containing protein [Methanospirillum hungatei]